MALAAAYAPPLRASMVPVALKRVITARSANVAAVPADRPVIASREDPLAVASNSKVNEPFCGDASGVVAQVSELIWQPGGGAGWTVIVAVPLCPSLVAAIVAEPAAMPVTSPLLLTVAAAVLLLDHVTARPDNVLPLASLGVAVSCTVLPAGTLAEAGETATEATATSVTVIVAVPVCPSLVAVIVADPGARPVTLPLTSATATEVLLLDQTIARPISALPLASFGVALRWTD